MTNIYNAEKCFRQVKNRMFLALSHLQGSWTVCMIVYLAIKDFHVRDETVLAVTVKLKA